MYSALFWVGRKLAVWFVKLLAGRALKRIVIEALVKLSAKSDNKVDDHVVNLIAKTLCGEEDLKDLEALKEKWSSKQ